MSEPAGRARGALAIVGWVLLGAPLSAQPGELRFDRISVEDGLSHSTVLAIVQDRLGFLWLATQEGLNRYDGYEFRVYRHDPEDPGSLAENEVFSLLEDRRGELWVGTFGGGLDRFVLAEERFEHHRSDPSEPASLSHGAVLCLAEDGSGALWAGTEDGLNRLEADGTFTRFDGGPAGAPRRQRFTVFALLEDRSGELWIGASDGLYRFAGERQAGAPGGVLALYRHPPSGDSSAGWKGITALAEDPVGGLWIGTGDGLRRLNGDGSLVHYRHEPSEPHSLGESFVQNLHLDRRGELWVGTISRGLDRFDRDAGVFVHSRHDPFDPESLSDNSVLSIYEDRAGILWLGSYVGVNRYDPRRERFVNYRQRPGRAQTLSSASLWALHEDGAGDLWVGTYDSGLDRLDRETGTVTHYPPDPRDPGALPHGTVSALHEDRSGVLWVGTWGGLSRLERDRDRFVTYRHDPDDPQSLGENTVYAIHEDRSGRLWVGTYGGLNRLEGPASRRGPPARFVRYPSAPTEPELLGETPIYAILEDRAGALWFASDRDGLLVLDAGGFRHLRHDPARAAAGDLSSLSSDKIAALYEDRSGVLWIGTYGSGLDALDPARARFRHYRRRDGLPSDTVLGILEDDDGHLWLSTTYGLSRFDPESEIFRNYHADDGLQGNVFSSRSAFRGASGEMFFGGIRGLTAFLPQNIDDDPQPPPVVITDFLLFNRSAPLQEADPGSPLRRSILATRELTLTHRDYVFALEFAALAFRSPRKNRYAYRLEGFDRDWIAADSSHRLAQYSNLRPGEYLFRVRGSNADSVWNEDGASLEITVLPPPWRTWWAWSLYALALVAAVWAALRSHRRKVERERAINRQLREADRLKGELISRLEEKTAELESFTYTVSHDLKSPLITLQGFLGFLERDVERGDVERVSRDVERLRGAAGKMHRLIDDLLELAHRPPHQSCRGGGLRRARARGLRPPCRPDCGARGGGRDRGRYAGGHGRPYAACPGAPEPPR